jgi:hypothetical protein
VPWPFKREEGDPTEAFANELFAAHDSWEGRIDRSARDDATRALLLSATAGATVAFGAHAAMLREMVAGGGGRPGDRVARFAEALDDRRAIEAAYRVVVWALVSEYAANLWPEQHEQEISKCEMVFGMENLYEESAVAYGQPSEAEGDEDQLDRMYDLVKATLYGMISAALREDVLPEDDSVNEHIDTWVEQFEAGIDAGAERLEELAPR